MEKEFYNQYTAADFVLDEDFVAWVQGADPESEAGWEKWLLENPGKRDEVEAARLIVRSMSFSVRPIEEETLEEEWTFIRENTVDSSSEPTEEKKPKTRRFFPFWVLGLAASVALLLLAGVALDLLPFSGFSSPELVEKQALNGQQLTIKLTDGTEIVLNAGSTLWYPEQFPAGKREVRLRGEAYFEVAPNARAPFLIQTDDVRVEVLGTKFVVKAYPENGEVKVAVVEGKVSVNPAPKQKDKAADPREIVLTRNEMATIEKKNREYIVSSYDENVLLGWKNGVLYFQKADFGEVIRKLERWYGVQISIEQGAGIDSTWRFSGKFENKPIDYILDVCRYPNRFSYKITDNKVSINK